MNAPLDFRSPLYHPRQAALHPISIAKLAKQLQVPRSLCILAKKQEGQLSHAACTKGQDTKKPNYSIVFGIPGILKTLSLAMTKLKIPLYSNYTVRAPPQSPPSTDSYHQHHDDPYRMRRLDSRADSVASPTSPSHQARASVPSSVDDIEHVHLPGEKASVGPDTDIESLALRSHHHGRQGKIRHGNQNPAPYSHGRLARANGMGTDGTHGTGTASIGPSVDDSEIGTSREGSIK
ncbi:hypothetical protein Agabi119p4_9005 [Agaricus bisporus var. burnettii]|uniref:Uncharacterized protein n=1 Tax=Agaricus bisporus var. burnettii TaxID=192524 RepID=A0A8H7C531_AGABI|nr:hypothetical protein Agabi119p4_9005 [Agaricus bisporus var. burnettii]